MTRSDRPTLEQVAARAGVGRGTASRVLNGSEQVSADRRAAVQRAVLDLGYVPNAAARALVTRRTGVVALVVQESEERLFAEPFFASIVRSTSAAVAASSRSLVLLLGRSVEARDLLADYLVAGHVDGVLLVSLHGPDPLPSRLEAAGVPIVIGGRPQDHTLHSWVDVDNEGGAEQAAEHLLSRGRRRIGLLAGPQDTAAGLWRLRGWSRALAAPPLEVVDFSEEGGRRGVTALLDRCPDLDGVLAASDLVAAGALAELLARGRRVPEDVSVVGFDDSPVSRHTWPPLTTVHQPVDELGAEMVRRLLGLLAGGPAVTDDRLLPTRLVVRASS